MSSVEKAAGERDWLRDGGETGRLIAARDWARTPLGPLEQWPAALHTTLNLMLRSPVPIVLLDTAGIAALPQRGAVTVTAEPGLAVVAWTAL